MNLEIFSNLQLEKNKKQSNSLLHTLLEDITKELEKMEQELVIDRFEGNMAVCENRKTKQMQEIPRKNLPAEATEGSILKYEKGKYQMDKEQQKEVEERIQNKMNRLWK